MAKTCIVTMIWGVCKFTSSLALPKKYCMVERDEDDPSLNQLRGKMKGEFDPPLFSHILFFWLLFRFVG